MKRLALAEIHTTHSAQCMMVVMIRRTPELDAFELSRLRKPADYRENLAILEDMWRFAREMGAFDRPRPPEDLEPDIRYARAINALHPPGQDRRRP